MAACRGDAALRADGGHGKIWQRAARAHAGGGIGQILLHGC